MSRSHNRSSPQASSQPSRQDSHSPVQVAEHPALSEQHPRGLMPELYFRWRGGEITRLEAFCDVVFGFALTLLVVSLEVPRNYAQLMDAIRGFAPFAVCFAQLVMIWRAHYLFSRRYGLEDPYTVFLTLVLLFLVLFYVYPLKFVFTMLFDQLTGRTSVEVGWNEASVLMRLYAAGFAAVFVLFALMYARAYKFRKEFGLNPVEALQTRFAIQENILLASVGAISFTLALKSPAWAGWWFFVLGPLLAVHGMVFSRRARRLAEKQAV